MIFFQNLSGRGAGLEIRVRAEAAGTEKTTGIIYTVNGHLYFF